jgi:hypothetical protein
MNKEQKIAKIISVIKLWGGFSPSEVDETFGLCVGELGSLVALVEYLSMDCIDVSVYSPSSFSSDSIEDYTMKYSELTDEVLDELLLLSIRYDDKSSEEEHLSNSAVGY